MLKFVFIFKLYLYDVWHTSKDGIYFERKYLIGSYWSLVGVCVFLIFVQRTVIKPLSILTLLLNACLQKPYWTCLCPVFWPQQIPVFQSTFYCQIDLPQCYLNSCTGSVWYPDPYNQLNWWDYFPGQLCFHKTMTCPNREKETVKGIRLNYVQSEWLNSTLH